MSKIIKEDEFKMYYPGIPTEVRDSHESLRESFAKATQVITELLHRQNIIKVQLSESISFIKATPCTCHQELAPSIDSCYRCETLNVIEKLGSSI